MLNKIRNILNELSRKLFSSGPTLLWRLGFGGSGSSCTDQPAACLWADPTLDPGRRPPEALQAAVTGAVPCRDRRVARRLSPQEWQEPGVCSMAGADPDFLENEMNLRNSFWFTIGSLMQQGCDINPKYVAGAPL